MEQTLWITLIALILIPRLFHAEGTLSQIGIFLAGLAALIYAIAFAIDTARHLRKDRQ